MNEFSIRAKENLNYRIDTETLSKWNTQREYTQVCLMRKTYSHKIASNHMNYAFKHNGWQHISALIIRPAKDVCQASLSLPVCRGMQPHLPSQARTRRAWEHTDKDT